jgi:hypothetical protein
MPSTEPPRPSLDYSAIRFPSDLITVGTIRKAHPERFDVDTPSSFRYMNQNARITLSEMISTERLLARAAFEEAMGKSVDVLAEEGLERPSVIAGMTEDYLKYGITTGKNHTEQMIRDIESQAAAQAQRHR